MVQRPRPLPPQRESPPSRTAARLAAATVVPVGREAEFARLRGAFEAAAAGECRVVLVAGPAGIGKSTLIHQLRPLVEARGGRFVAGKFELHVERESTALLQALGALGRLLLAQTDEDERAQLRSRILRALGAGAPWARVIPEFARLLPEVPEPAAADPAHAAARLVELALGLLRAVASPQRVLVLALDDMQWSGALATRLLDALAGASAESSPGAPGLLLVAAFRDDELAPSHPLALAAARWQALGRPADRIAVAPLEAPHLATLAARALGVDAAATDALAQALLPHAGGNPFAAIELLGALLDNGLLAVAAGHVRLEPDAVGRWLDTHGVTDVLAARIAALPGAARELLRTLACATDDTSREVARALVDLDSGGFDAALAVLHDQGFVARGAGFDGILRLRHDRLRQAAYASVAPRERGGFHHALARRAQRSGIAAAAADHYARAVDEVREPPEARQAVALLRAEAASARALGNYQAAWRLTGAALHLAQRGDLARDMDAATRAGCECDHHLALYHLGRIEDAVALYGRIEARVPDALQRIDAACVQIECLISWGRMAEAFALAIGMLRRLGVDVPDTFDDDDAQAEAAARRVREWADVFDDAAGQGGEGERAASPLPWVGAVMELIVHVMIPAFFVDRRAHRWLVQRAVALWQAHGPSAALVGAIAGIGFHLGDSPENRRAGYRICRGLARIAQARRWEPQCFTAVMGLHLSAGLWFDPMERRVAETRQAAEGHLAAGDLRNAVACLRLAASGAFDCGPTLEAFAEIVDTALALARRCDDRVSVRRLLLERDGVRVLRDETARPGRFDDEVDGEEAYRSDALLDPRMRATHASQRAAVYAVFGDATGLARCIGAMRAERRSLEGLPPAVSLRWLGGLACVQAIEREIELRIEPPEGGTHASPERAELDASIAWLRERAVDAPFNFRHMALHLRAERAWLLGQAEAASTLFDEALQAADHTRRPWHQALIAERASRMQAARGLHEAAGTLLREALALYTAWGATGPANALAARLASADLPPARFSSSAAPQHPGAALDATAAAATFRALSAQWTVPQVLAQAVAALGDVTGATRTAIALHEGGGWTLLPCAEQPPGGAPLPRQALDFVLRTREPLAMADALLDEDFGRDLRFAGLACRSLLVVPVLHQGEPCAAAVLEDSARPGAFDAAALDAVATIVAQLGVALERASLNERLARRVAEQTLALREAQARLVDQARGAGMAQVAANVLHNVGNVLTSVNVSVHVLTEKVRRSRRGRVADVAALLNGRDRGDPRFFAEGGPGRVMVRYLRELGDALAGERGELLAEIDGLAGSVDRIAEAVAMQQSYAGVRGLLQPCDVAELLGDALRLQDEALAAARIAVRRDFAAGEPRLLDKPRVMQVLLGLVENACDAMRGVAGERVLTLGARADGDCLRLWVADTGVGIPAGDLDRIFMHGFTTKPGAHGFGLHGCAIAAVEMGGSLRAESDGPGFGARFTLTLPQRPAPDSTDPRAGGIPLAGSFIDGGGI